uniref:Uncharacterized protein n=1 Tax=Anguilla anguilla TaxID=7936 RepID=A0A0E9VE58_ANGAN
MQNQCPRADKQYYSWLLMTGINQKNKRKQPCFDPRLCLCTHFNASLATVDISDGLFSFFDTASKASAL